MQNGIVNWRSQGRYVTIRLVTGVERQIFVCDLGDRSHPVVTLLHGFPTSSGDWQKIAGLLSKHFRVIAFDFLGFGFSDKPRYHYYNIHEQADVTEAVWSELGVQRTLLVAHDYGTSVAQELIARQDEELLLCQIDKLVFLNGALFADLHRPLLIQKLLAHPTMGPVVALLITKSTFEKNMARVFSKQHPATQEDIDGFWQAVSHLGGNRIYHRLIHYMADRKRFSRRWEGALLNTDIPWRLVWGMEDPVSGRQVVEHIRRVRPTADIVELDGVGHYPQTEVPVTVTQEILASFSSGKSG
jgi:pimeloyl-ACP methyl ester carboxylesterase